MQQGDESNEENLLKIIVIGDSQVGKTSLITQFFDQKFHTHNVATVGVDFRIKKNVSLSTGMKYHVSIWDTAGQEQFKSIVKFSCKVPSPSPSL